MTELRRYFKIGKSLIRKNWPSYLIFFVTAMCNSRCKFCFYWNQIETAKPENELSLKEIEKISKNLGTTAYLSLSGGEPFLRNDLAEICSLFYQNSDIQIINIPTNGLLSEKIEACVNDILNRCKEIKLNIDLSLDALGEDHNKIRGVENNFQRLIDTYNRLKKITEKYNNLSVSILTVFSVFNQNKIEDVFKFVKDRLNVADHRLGLIRGNSRMKEASDISFEKYEQALSIMRRYEKKKKKISVAVLRSLFDTSVEIGLDFIKYNKRTVSCVAGKKILIISEQGEVYPCELLDKSFGNLRDFDYDLKKVLFSDRGLMVKKFISESKCCCSWECANQNNAMYNIIKYPSILKFIFKNYFKK